MSKTVRNLCFSAMCLALCMVLPLITGGIPKIGNMLSPMHLPVFICGFVCGYQYGMIVGFTAPIMRSLIFTKPVMYPMAVAMSFELAVYGLICGILYKIFPKKNAYVYLALVVSMLCGRLVWGISRYIMAGLSGSEFDISMFIAGAFTDAIPGIILQIIIIPLIIIALRKTNLIQK